MSPFFDALEQRHPDEREAALLRALPGQIAHAQTRAPAFAGILAGVDAAAVITSRAALATLPVTRKHELLEPRRSIAARAAVCLAASAPSALARHAAGVRQPRHDLRARRHAGTTGAWPAPSLRRVSGPAN
jgi:hypothetical protein